jgi:hypothetical protein
VTPEQVVALVGAGIIGLTIIGLLIRVVILDQRFMDAHRLRMADLEATATIFRGPVRGDH